ncbi:hypothetical protein LTR37_017410 [Vermiconidia calcicola]|uniref:Uncharacterized protein n=1 Tax=Vermiconidia calcicola TaxID=1690605 RepID=A0ACC3MKP6_9PEZI|nr:hypothetical protein LTR37_017410 [Vermiconidia calcicola]
MAPQGTAYDVDWVFSDGSNVHVAQHRGWFTSYTAFKTKLITMNGDTMVVEGIGQVQLDVKTDDNTGVNEAHRTIVLRDVLHKDYNVIINWGKDSGCLKDKSTGDCAGLCEFNALAKLWLLGQRKGRSSLEPNECYVIGVQWPEEEIIRWKLKVMVLERVQDSKKEPAASSGAPYTGAEKAWLKVAFGGEFYFLKRYGLSIYEEDDRKEGRRIARTLIKGDAKEEDNITAVHFCAPVMLVAGTWYVSYILCCSTM